MLRHRYVNKHMIHGLPSLIFPHPPHSPPLDCLNVRSSTLPVQHQYHYHHNHYHQHH